MIAVWSGNNSSPKLVIKEVQGPSSYTTGGFPVDFPEFKKVLHAFTVIKYNDALYKVSTAVSDGTPTVVVTVYEVSYNSTSGSLEVKEVASGTDLSGYTFVVTAIVE